jgi:tetratricopeptide (TPR) repeat protein
MLAYVYTDWCPYCRRFDQGILDTPEGHELLRDFIKVRVNPEKGEAEKSIARGLGARGYPSVFVIARPAAEPQRAHPFTGPRERTRLRSPAEFAAGIERAIAAEAGRLARRGYELQRAGDLAGAAAELDRALSLDPRNAWVHYARGLLHGKRGEKEKAIVDFRLAAALRPKFPEAYDHLGSLAFDRRCLEGAVRYFTFVSEMTGGERKARALYKRGAAFFHRGDTGNARRDAVSACELGYAPACRKVEELRQRGKD